jgi:hypothetical protein
MLTSIWPPNAAGSGTRKPVSLRSASDGPFALRKTKQTTTEIMRGQQKTNYSQQMTYIELYRTIRKVGQNMQNILQVSKEILLASIRRVSYLLSIEERSDKMPKHAPPRTPTGSPSWHAAPDDPAGPNLQPHHTP